MLQIAENFMIAVHMMNLMIEAFTCSLTDDYTLS